MPTPLEEFISRLEDIEADLNFSVRASQLRPRLADALNWEAHAETVALARSFMDEKRSRVEGVIAGLLVRVIASFERYMRRLIEANIDSLSRSARNIDEIPSVLRSRNLMLTGRIIAAMDNPRDHQNFNYEELIANLASCRPGASPFRLNASAFSSVITGSSPELVERALRNLEVEEWWDDIGANADLQRLFGTRKSRETGARARERLKELTRWRNQIAHAGDEEVALTDGALIDAIKFAKYFAAALDQKVSTEIKAVVGGRG